MINDRCKAGEDNEEERRTKRGMRRVYIAHLRGVALATVQGDQMGAQKHGDRTNAEHHPELLEYVDSNIENLAPHITQSISSVVTPTNFGVRGCS